MTLATPLTTDQIGRVVPMDERQARIAWSVVAEPGDRLAAMVIDHFGPAKAFGLLIDNHPALLDFDSADHNGIGMQAGIDRWYARATSGNIERAITQLHRFGIHTVVPLDDEWPAERLARLGLSAPWVLFGRGDISLLADPQIVGIVGARAATGYGEHVTIEMAAGLSDRKMTIVSGAAHGIDGHAHRATLDSRGRTIAVMAGGLDRLFPAGHEALLARIVESGLVVSDMPPGTMPTKWRFLQRNRIIAALSDVVVVVEAGWRSGSLNTAGHAKDIGVTVAAVPGPVTSAASAGCHRLISSFGAELVTSAEDVAGLVPELPKLSHDEIATPLLDAMSKRTARTVADLAARAGLNILDVTNTLATLERDGDVKESERGWVRL